MQRYGPTRNFVTEKVISNRGSMPHFGAENAPCKGTVIATRPWAHVFLWKEELFLNVFFCDFRIGTRLHKYFGDVDGDAALIVDHLTGYQ